MRKCLILVVVFLLTSTQIESGVLNRNYERPLEVKREVLETKVQNENVELTLGNIKYQLDKYDLEHPDILMKQIRLETGNLKYVKHNNLFGFKNNRYLKFKTWIACIEYAKEWQDENYNGGDYYRFLKKIGYAKDPSYIKKLKKM